MIHSASMVQLTCSVWNIFSFFQKINSQNSLCSFTAGQAAAKDLTVNPHPRLSENCLPMLFTTWLWMTSYLSLNFITELFLIEVSHAIAKLCESWTCFCLCVGPLYPPTAPVFHHGPQHPWEDCFSSLWGTTALLAQASVHQPARLHNVIWGTPLLLLQLV